MRLARRRFLASTIAAAAAPAIVRLARADAPQVTLKLHHFFSSVSSAHDKFLAPWARKVETDSSGRIRIDIFPSMQLGGAPAQLFDQARDGIADIVWAVPANTPGRFPRIELFELPFVSARRALVNSRAIEDYAAANLKDEFHDVHPLAFSCRDRGVVHANRAIQSIEEFRGLRLHVPNRLAGEAVQALGAQAVAMPLPQVPIALAGQVINGCLDPWDVVPGLKLHDLLKAHTDFADASLSTTTFVLAMNKAAYDRLPRGLKAVIDENSGQVAAGMAGAMWDAEAEAAAAMVRGRGDPVTVLAVKDVARWRKATEPVISTWLKQMRERRIDGGKLLVSAHALLAKYADEPEPPEPPPRQTVQPQQSQPPRPRPEQQVVTHTQQPPQGKVDAPKLDVPKPNGPKLDAPKLSAPKLEAPASVARPVAKPAPAPAPPKELDIPL